MDKRSETTEQIGDYEIPIDPMENLECDSCQ